MTGNVTLDDPTNPTDGQMVRWEIIQGGSGSYTVTLGAKFRFGSDLTSFTASTTVGKRDYLAAQYNGPDDKWDVVAYSKGY